MKTNTYYGKNVLDAMNRAKAELGEAVIILETRKLNGTVVEDHPDARIEITAAVESHDSLMEHSEPIGEAADVDPAPSYLASELTEMLEMPDDDQVKNRDRTQRQTVLEQEIQKLNDRLYGRNTTEFSPPFSTVYHKLVELGVTRAHASAITRSVQKQLDDKKLTPVKVLGQLKKEVTARFEDRSPADEASSDGQKLVMLAGPTGTGKTTSIMKLALHPGAYRDQKVAIISTDAYRMAAAEPLKAFSRISSIPVFEVKKPVDAVLQISQLKEYDVILIDTPGRSPYFPHYLETLKTLITHVKPQEILLTLSATTDIDDIIKASALYLAMNPTGIIITKQDETVKPGKVISIQEELDLPVQYLCSGQSIPYDIDPVDRNVIMTKILTTI